MTAPDKRLMHLVRGLGSPDTLCGKQKQWLKYVPLADRFFTAPDGPGRTHVCKTCLRIMEKQGKEAQ